MAGQTVVARDSALANKVFSVALFSQTMRRPSFRKNMTGQAPKQSDAEAQLKGQSDPDYPFVQVNDLTKQAGERVSVDMVNTISGKPIMGDRKLAGRMMSLKTSSMDIYIDQYRGGVDPGGRMTQQRTLYNLRSLAVANLSGWSSRLEDQLCLVHVAGARGTQNDKEWLIPLATDPDFAEIMVNTVKAPTANRRYFGGNATSVANLDTTDLLGLDTIDDIRNAIDNMAFPLQPIRLEGDTESDEEPLYVLFVTPDQWRAILKNTSDQNWRTFLASAFERAKDMKNHPLFRGSPGMWNGILVKKMRRAIRWQAGDTVYEVDGGGVEQPIVAAVKTDRALLMGAQAMAYAYGKHPKSDYYMSMYEEPTDHENTIEFSCSTIGGKAKLRFVDADGNTTDHGVITVDSYVP